MIDFHHQDNIVSVTISGWLTVFLIMFIVFEMGQFYVTKSTFTQKLIIYFYLRRQLKLVIPPWWEIKRIGLITIGKYDGCFNCYVELRPKYGTFSQAPHKYLTNDFVKTSWSGKIIKIELVSNIEIYDKLYGSELKEWKRNWNLERLSI